jgi:hypothetical protein
MAKHSGLLPQLVAQSYKLDELIDKTGPVVSYPQFASKRLLLLPRKYAPLGLRSGVEGSQETVEGKLPMAEVC